MEQTTKKATKAKLTLATICICTGLVSMLGLDIQRENLSLYYLTTINLEIRCVRISGNTTTNQAGANTFPQLGATGWYTNSMCSEPITFYERTIGD